MPTKIEWCDETWNPITGCSPVSPGCDHCYAKRLSKRFASRWGYNTQDPFAPGTFHPDRLYRPHHLKKSRRIFVCSMGDMFHRDVDVGNILMVMSAMRETWQHTYYVLTKRSHLMLSFFVQHTQAWPANVWAGISAETQEFFDARIKHLEYVGVPSRFVSLEPLLGPIALGDSIDWLDWVIVGGETGPEARPLEMNWVRSIRDECVQSGTPFFFKGSGGMKRSPRIDGELWQQIPD